MVTVERRFDKRRAAIPNQEGRVDDQERKTAVPQIYTAGLAKRGPSGVIGHPSRAARE